MKMLLFMACLTFAAYSWSLTPALAYMTLFNDTGSWAAGTLVDMEDDSTVYRICKNSRDRNESESGNGSLAIICLTANPNHNTTTLGIWHTEAIAQPGHQLECEVRLDGDQPENRICKVIKSHFGNGQILLSEDKPEIKKILAHKKIAVNLKAKNSDHQSEILEFDVEPEELLKIEKDFHDFF